MKRSTYVKLIVAAILIASLVVGMQVLSFAPPSPVRYGVTFSPEYARYLGIDPQKTFSTIIDEWGFKDVRLAAEWDTVEPVKGKFNFTELDALMNQSAKGGVKVILAVGQKTPHWPECHLPVWTDTLSESEYAAARNQYITTVVERYKNHPALEIWQVENEPLLDFGNCPPFSLTDLKAELALVKKLDPAHGTLVTDSGEINSWQTTARIGDYFGTTLYKVVWNKYTGYLHYDWFPPSWYRVRTWLAGRSPATAFVIELQAEPWLPDKPITEVSFEEQDKSMSIERFKKNVAFANRVGYSRIYLWGAEWWYLQAVQGRGEFAEYAKSLNK